MKELYAGNAANIADRILEVAEEIKANDSCILVFPHKSVDGDCIGSSCAAVSIFRALGAKAWVAMPEALPENMSFMGVEDLLFYPDEAFFASGVVNGITNTEVMSVDCSEGHRMGPNGDYFDKASGKHLSIDHHEVTHLINDYRWIEPKASSASELVFYAAVAVADKSGIDLVSIIDSRAAKCLLTGIVTDTGRFTYQNTNPETLEVAGQLMELGGDISTVCYNLFDRKKPQEFMISNTACVNAQFLCDGRFAITVVTEEMFKQFNATTDDIADVVSRLRDIDGVDLAVVLREAGGGVIRGNLRSTEAVDCTLLAGAFGGGGHKRASGFSVDGGDIEEIKNKVIEKAQILL